MKTILTFTLFTFFSLLAFGNSFEANQVSSSDFELCSETEADSKRVRIDMWLTSAEGCKFHIVGDFSAWSFTFTGTVTGTGGAAGCPEGTWTFGLVTNNGDGEIEIHGSNPFVDILKEDKDLLLELVRLIESA